MKSKQPFLPLFFGDLLAATPRWKGPQRSLYILLLAYQWFDGPIPNSPSEIADMCGYPLDEFEKLWAIVGRKFVPCEGGLMNLRCEEHRIKAERISKKRATAGKKGGQTTKAKLQQTGKQIGRQTERQTEQQKGEQTGQQTKSDLLPSLLGHPSHPIPSHPNPSQGVEDDAEEDAPPTGRISANAKPEGIMAIHLRQAGVRVTSQDPVLATWLRDGISVERLIEAVSIARISKPHEAIPAKYLDKIVRDESRSLERNKTRAQAAVDAFLKETE